MILGYFFYWLLLLSDELIYHILCFCRQREKAQNQGKKTTEPSTNIMPCLVYDYLKKNLKKTKTKNLKTSTNFFCIFFSSSYSLHFNG